MGNTGNHKSELSRILDSKTFGRAFADFLKKEYGIGGSSFEGGFVDSTSMGIRIYEKDWMNRKEYTWTQIADEILNMISTNTY